uniref:60S ribosomal protein L21 n=1 Tax=Strombidium rassoulzadegani TaxID=1082188 RepID=A0A7S3FVZ4_9SPIT|mmetsp:Transcript_2647/g.4428  ORF Transcript_2647/g.4428 Transcript_2647/m.4428 type:complete len:159 (+) Transcript_2647:47-523(+)|eukprot:CAMPEP_0168607674 /NCGR_PEP_ID=MMETSP0449_2-20121227/188_1 /TAXON_ID=1082188 /ORGANISM="Strombidium rassoulzadegani, Strain ras09" /LENGTH=158 /DNA_ID=CAMNT_0008647545 /DNA_START=587 /DNA_END=1063 /DNA_ORIENTATION=-
MPHSFGVRARTRDLFAKPYKKHGAVPFSKYFTTYKTGDYVDVIADGSIHKGMPHKFYHGKTGRVFNVNAHAVGVIVNKLHNGRIIPKRIHVRIEHVRKSRSREAFVERIKKNDELKRQAKKDGKKIVTKREAVGPSDAHVVSGKDVKYMNPLKFRELY